MNYPPMTPEYAMAEFVTDLALWIIESGSRCIDDIRQITNDWIIDAGWVYFGHEDEISDIGAELTILGYTWFRSIDG